jgi:hypothetical protein
VSPFSLFCERFSLAIRNARFNDEYTVAQRLSIVTIVFCVLAVFCEGIDLQAGGVAASGIAAEFKASPAQMGTSLGGAVARIISLLMPASSWRVDSVAKAQPDWLPANAEAW